MICQDKIIKLLINLKILWFRFIESVDTKVTQIIKECKKVFSSPERITYLNTYFFKLQISVKSSCAVMFNKWSRHHKKSFKFHHFFWVLAKQLIFLSICENWPWISIYTETVHKPDYYFENNELKILVTIFWVTHFVITNHNLSFDFWVP